MKYIVRALKYFVYISLIVTVILLILMALKLVSPDINVMFRNGWGSVLQIAIMFLAVSAIYPKFGYAKRGVRIPGSYSEIRDKVVSFMEERGYELETEEGENLTFRLRNRFNRAARTWEDRITLTRELAGFYMEGISKDVARLASAMEFKFQNPET
ncbi:MAG: hypothetical protein J6Y61_05025 [Bacteroidales bacterium]|nr:hypothetical protein [Bacteroidales bacterium]